MLNNSLLKETLSQKIAAHSDAEVQRCSESSLTKQDAIKSKALPPPSINVVLNLSLPPQDAQAQIDLLQALIKSVFFDQTILYLHKPSQEDSCLKWPQPDVTKFNRMEEPQHLSSVVQKQSSTAEINPSVKKQEKSASLMDPITERQLRLIEHVTKQNNISLEFFRKLLLKKFGIQTISQLSKKQASEIISTLLER